MNFQFLQRKIGFQKHSFIHKGKWVTCYIELPEEYDAGEILCGTVKLNGAVPCEKSDAGDYDKDGIPDIMVKFDREHAAGIFQPADAVTVTVDGMAGSVRFTGTDVIRVIDEGKSKGKNTGTPLTADAGYALNNAETTAVYYFHCDHLGTPQAITDENGSVVWKADYKPFGEITLTTAAVENNFRFPGQFYDAETGLHYNWHRYYDAGTGRYLTPDPIGLEGGINLYAYVMNNPVNMIDPFGLETLSFDKVANLVKENNRSGLSDSLVICLIYKESTFETKAKNPKSSAKGLMQMTKIACKDMKVQYKDIDDPAANISAGTSYIALRIRRAGDITKGLEGFGTGKGYAKGILECEKCLVNSLCDKQSCLDKVKK